MKLLIVLLLGTGFNYIQAQSYPSVPSDWPRFMRVNEDVSSAKDIITFHTNEPQTVYVALVGTKEAQEKFVLSQIPGDPKGWVVRLKPGMTVDHEQQSRYRLFFRMAFKPITDFLTSAEIQEEDIYVFLNDLNDYPPHFQNLPYSCSVREGQSSGVIFNGTVAIDKDLSTAGLINFSFEDKNIWKDKFRVDPITGFVSLSGSLDYETFTQYQISITAKDLAPPYNSASAHLRINVVDVNDTAPVFNFQPYFAKISENLAIGSKIVSIFAVDGDRGVNTPVKVAFWNSTSNLPQTEYQYFSIDSDTGMISIKSKIDRQEKFIRERGGILSYKVIAYEENSVWGPQTTSITTVTITVQDDCGN